MRPFLLSDGSRSDTPIARLSKPACPHVMNEKARLVPGFFIHDQ